MSSQKHSKEKSSFENYWDLDKITSKKDVKMSFKALLSQSWFFL